MASSNKTARRPVVHTHEGAPTYVEKTYEQLLRASLACMLFEDQFYEEGVEISTRIKDLVPQVKPELVAQLAVAARSQFKLRHLPLFLVREMARYEKHKPYVSSVLYEVIQRADELAEFLAIYWKDGKDQPISNQVKKGLARAFTKFTPYELAKYNRDKEIKLRDVMFLVHPKPEDESLAEVWDALANKKLASPDTWEVAISACQLDEAKKVEWTRLLVENKLGALALIRNIRNMTKAGVDPNLIKYRLEEIKVDKVLPFRFLTAARHNPYFEPLLEKAMYKAVAGHPKLKGRTILVMDVSGSMDDPISEKSEITRLDAASAIAILLKEICEDLVVYTFSDDLIQVPARRGVALRDCINNSQPHHGTYLGKALNTVDSYNKNRYDRMIVLTDEQSHDRVDLIPSGKGYLINVGSNEHGVAYDKQFHHITGFSEHVIDYIQTYESFYLSKTDIR